MTHPARDIVRFKSEHFAPVLPEDCQVNPGVYGAELAFWLSAELARSGVATSYPNPEDWGWFIEFLPDSGSEFAVHCGKVPLYFWQRSLTRYRCGTCNVEWQFADLKASGKQQNSG